MKHFITLVSAWTMFSFALFANNLQITNIAVDQTVGNKFVSFSISWDNSWYVSSAPNNYDAVWIFVKWKDCALTASDPYTHGVLSLTRNDHTIGSGLDVMTTTTTPGSSIIAAGGSLDNDAGGFSNGIMIRRSTIGSGTVPTTACTLKVPGLPAPATTISTKVFGIEMVFIPQANFYVGDGDGGSGGAQYRIVTATLNQAQLIDATYETGAQTIYYYNGSPLAIAGVPAAWPKGQYGFYMMKYEITESKYAEFLNTLSSSAQSNRFPGNFGTNRNQMQQASAGVYVAGRPSRAQNWLGWADVSAYLDWACLRPMTEFEYEKAARGPVNAVTGEYAWGTNSDISAATTFNSPGVENGTESITGNCNYNSTTFSNGDGGTGPIRVGIFATATSDRKAAGASYYGVLELSGNVLEYVVVLNTSSNGFTRQWGDGAIDVTTGLATGAGISTWPASSNGATDPADAFTNPVGNRGGSWTTTIANGYLQVSNRSFCYDVKIARYNYGGGRGVR